MEKRNTLLLTVIAIATLLVAVVGATFAYFASTINTNNGDVNLNLQTSDNRAVFTSSASGGVNITVDSYMMQQHDAVEGDDGNVSNNTAIAGNLVGNANINVTLQASENNHETTCTYDLVFQWNSSSQNNFNGEGYTNLSSKNEGIGSGGNKYYPNSYYVRTGYKDGQEENSVEEGFKEFTIEVSSMTYTNSSDEKGTSKEDLSEVNIDAIKKDENGKIKLLEGEQITSTSKDLSGSPRVIYTIEFRFYNLNKDQSHLMGKNFAGTVSVENIIC